MHVRVAAAHWCKGQEQLRGYGKPGGNSRWRSGTRAKSRTNWGKALRRSIEFVLFESSLRIAIGDSAVVPLVGSCSLCVRHNRA